MILVVTLLIGLASWRWWRLAAVDTITEPIRDRVLDYDAPRGTARWWLTALVDCPWCLGFWIALAHVVVIAVWGDYGWAWWEIPMVTMAASAICGLLNEAEDALLG